ncbi:uncharacterized protein LOC126808954 isoform X2 [Patella vulgata]|uniref:uncharacterized protein LOC126808954 isoform X2 n=1 Tax=Patella vulgata TaxID=6465 RepID=UPI00218012D6|nr:uncharacterized protein LOC126808954 isoform X2 [Patella vulgata]
MLLMIAIIFSLSQVSAVDVCSSQTLKIWYEVFTIPETAVGETYKLIYQCKYPDKLQFAVGEIMCMGNDGGQAFWGTFQMNIKCHPTRTDTSTVTHELGTIVKDVNQYNAKNYLERMKMLTSDISAFIDVLYTTYILDKIVKSNDLSYKDAVNCIHIVNNIQELPEDILELSNAKAQQNLMAIVEELELKMPTSDDVDDRHARIVTDTMVVAVWDIQYTDMEPVIGLRVDGELTQPMEINTIVPVHDKNNLYTENTVVGISLDKRIVRGLLNGGDSTHIRLAVHIFNNPRLFSTYTEDVINSYIIGLTVAVNKMPIRRFDNSHVKIVFSPKQILQEHVKEKYTQCAYWKFIYWSESSDPPSSTTDGKNTCTSKYLGNFVLQLNHNGLNFVRKLFLSQMVTIGKVFTLSCYLLCFMGWIFVRKSRIDNFWLYAYLLLTVLIPYLVNLFLSNQPGGLTEARVLQYLTIYFLSSSINWLLADGVIHHYLFAKKGTKKGSALLLRSTSKSGMNITLGILMLRDATILYQTIFSIVNMVQSLLISVRFIVGVWSKDEMVDDEQTITCRKSHSSTDNDGSPGPLDKTVTHIKIDEEKKPLTETGPEPIVDLNQ